MGDVLGRSPSSELVIWAWPTNEYDHNDPLCFSVYYLIPISRDPLMLKTSNHFSLERLFLLFQMDWVIVHSFYHLCWPFLNEWTLLFKVQISLFFWAVTGWAFPQICRHVTVNFLGCFENILKYFPLSTGKFLSVMELRIVRSFDSSYGHGTDMPSHQSWLNVIKVSVLGMLASKSMLTDMFTSCQ